MCHYTYWCVKGQALAMTYTERCAQMIVVFPVHHDSCHALFTQAVYGLNALDLIINTYRHSIEKQQTFLHCTQYGNLTLPTLQFHGVSCGMYRS